MFVAPSAQQQKSSPFPLAGYAMAGGMLGLGARLHHEKIPQFTALKNMLPHQIVKLLGK